MKLRSILLCAAMLSISVPAMAEELNSAQAEKRLRGCLAAGSAGATGDLASAVTAARAMCLPQIRRVQELRTAHLALPEERDQAVRDLNREIAQAIANFTGLRL